MTILQLIRINLLAFCLVACTASMPSQEMSDARQAMQTAKDADALLYLPDYLQHIEQDLLKAEQALSAGDYDTARSLADTAKQQAIVARQMSLALSKAETLFSDLTELDAPTSAATLELQHLLLQAKASAQFGELERVEQFTQAILQQGEQLKAQLQAD